MLNTNNEINIKKEERKYSWSTVFAWLYLKTIGRILPKRWNRWAENILYYDKTTANNEVQTDAFKTVDESAQVDLKPEVAEKESQSVVISKDGGVQTDGVALCVEKVDKSVEVNLKPEVAEKDGEITSEDEGIYSEVNDASTGEGCSDIEDELIENNYCEVYEEDDEALKEQLEGISQELELECSQNASLKEENRELRSAVEGLEKSYKGLTEDASKREEELTKYKQDKKAMQDKVDEQQKTIFDQYMIIREQGDEIEATRKDNESLQAQIIELKSRLKDKEDKLIELNQQWQASKLVASLKSQTDKLWQARDKNTELENKVSNLGHENEALRLSVNTLTAQLGEVENLRKQLQSVQESKQQLEIDLEGKLKDLSSQLSTAVNEKKDLEDKVSELQEQKQTLKENKENVQQGKANMKLAAKSEELRKTKTDLSQQNKALQAQLNREKNEVKRQKGIIFKKDNEIKKLKEEKGRLGEVTRKKSRSC
ncbi:MAG: hypothetical protein LBU02_00720 [Rickettsiales bacterium]|jgi:cancer susceptibility candidate protein 1|nr:hypothetical protein [Rickettsiales bacterium]